MSRYVFYGLVLQVATLSILMASIEVKAQRKSMSDICLSIEMKNATLEEIFTEIEQGSGLRFAYNHDNLKNHERIDLKVTDQSLAKILEYISQQSKLKFKRIDENIHVSKLRGNDVEVIEEIFDTQQSRTVTGKVTSQEDQEGLPGVNVIEKGTNNGIVTDVKGVYSLEVSEGAILVFSSVGYVREEVEVGNRSVVDLVMSHDVHQLDELVVTAFGITREQKQLNYSVQKVDGELLAATGNIDVSKGLQGKIAGVTVRQLSGAPGRSTKVTIRGSNSITGDNSPLYVVDGSPVDGNVALSINPNEIENMSVLKGATSAALYGLRASNGVILISTKRGKTNEMNKTMVSFNANYSFDRLAVYPETQKIYGQGVKYVFDPYSAYSFGPKISEWGTYINQLGEEEEAKVYDAAKEFFRIGGTHDSNINISNRFEKGNYSAGVGYSNQSGIIPGTDFNRISAKFASDYEISDKITLSTSANYSTYETNSFKEEGGSGSLFYAAFNVPPSYDYKNKPTHVVGNPYQQLNFRGQHDNIYWILKNSGDNLNGSNLIGSASINYNPAEWLNINYRLGLDESMFEGNEVYGFGSGATGGRTVPPSGGQITENMNKRRSINSTFMAMANHKFTNKLELEVLAGNEFYDFNYKSLSSTGRSFTIPDLHHLSNSSDITSSQYLGRRRSYAFFGDANIIYDEMLSLSATIRNDVVSNMPRNNRSFIYPSIGMGFTFTEIMNDPGFLTFGKVRASYAEVGQAGSIYSTSTVYTQASASRFPFPYNGINAFSLSSNLKSTDLEPENTKAWEVGANLVFLNNRINLDYTYYKSKSEGQIFSVPISSTTGFTAETRNAGEMVNQGHEIVLSIRPVVSETFSWDFTTNFAAFTNKVTELAEGVDELSLGGASFVAFVVAREGEHYPVLRGYGYARDQNGKIVVKSDDPASIHYGMPLRSPSSDVIFGKADPDFEINFLNTIRYKNFSLYAQIDWRQGGVVGSGDVRLAKLYGTHYETQFREEDYIIPNSVKGYFNAEGNLVVEGDNSIPIKRDYDYYRLMDGVGEQSVYDASFIRLREVKINYDLPVDILQKLNITSVAVFVIGRNLWLIKSGMPYYDPEMNDTAGNGIGYTSTAYPQISNLGFGVNLKF